MIITKSIPVRCILHMGVDVAVVAVAVAVSYSN